MDGSHNLDAGRAGLHPGQARQVADMLAGGASVLLASKGAMACLCADAHQAGASRTRVVLARPPLDLPRFLEQVAGAFPAPDETPLERAFTILTEPDASCDRVVLLVGDAHLLPHTTLHYIESAMRAGPQLQAVLAGQPALAELLALPDFKSLRGRLSLLEDAPPGPAAPVRAPPVPPLPVPTPPVARSPHLDVATLACALAVGAAAAWLAWPAPPAPRAAAIPAPPAGVTEAPPVPARPAAVREAAPPAQAAPPAPAPPLPAPAPPTPPPPPAAIHLPPPPVPTRPALPRPERVADPAAAALNERRCRDIVLRTQLGDAPTDDERSFLRNGCR